MAAIGNAQWYLGTYLLLIVLLTGCAAEQLLQNLNNGNDDPEVLIVEEWGTNIRHALEFNTGYDCLGTSDFTAQVEIRVYTASYVDLSSSMSSDTGVEIRVYTASYVDGQVLPDPDPLLRKYLGQCSFLREHRL